MALQPEQILQMATAPMMAAVNDYGQGLVDLEKLKLLQQYRQAEEAAQQQAARDIVAMRNAGDLETARLHNEREDIRQTAMDRRAREAQEAMLEKMNAAKQMEYIEQLTNDLGKVKSSVPPRLTNEGNPAYIIRLQEALNTARNRETENVARMIRATDNRIMDLQSRIQELSDDRTSAKAMAVYAADHPTEGFMSRLTTEQQNMIMDLEAGKAVKKDGKKINAEKKQLSQADAIKALGLQSQYNGFVENMTQVYAMQGKGLARELIDGLQRQVALEESRRLAAAQINAEAFRLAGDPNFDPGTYRTLTPKEGEQGKKETPEDREAAFAKRLKEAIESAAKGKGAGVSPPVSRPAPPAPTKPSAALGGIGGVPGYIADQAKYLMGRGGEVVGRGGEAAEAAFAAIQGVDPAAAIRGAMAATVPGPLPTDAKLALINPQLPAATRAIPALGQAVVQAGRTIGQRIPAAFNQARQAVPSVPGRVAEVSDAANRLAVDAIRTAPSFVVRPIQNMVGASQLTMQAIADERDRRRREQYENLLRKRATSPHLWTPADEYTLQQYASQYGTNAPPEAVIGMQ